MCKMCIRDRGTVVPVVQSLGRGVGQQQVDAAPFVRLMLQLVHTAAHGDVYKRQELGNVQKTFSFCEFFSKVRRDAFVRISIDSQI